MLVTLAMLPPVARVDPPAPCLASSIASRRPRRPSGRPDTAEQVVADALVPPRPTR